MACSRRTWGRCQVGNATLWAGANRGRRAGCRLLEEDAGHVPCRSEDDGRKVCRGLGDDLTLMDFHSYTTMRDWTRRADPDDRPAQDIDQFYKRAIADALRMGSGQFLGQMHNERDWEKARRPYYNLWPSIVPMLTW